MSSNQDFDKKYRPPTLDKVIGNEQIVTRLKGIIKSGNIPKAMLFCGPTSAGKTTLVRAFVADLFGVGRVSENSHVDYHESNAANQRKIDDIRDLLKVVRLKPRSAPRRVFFFDEAQQITGDAGQLILKPTEEPPPQTMFIFGSMEPEKLLPALKNRCQQFVLQGYTKEEVIKFIKRIRKGEGMDYVPDELLPVVAENSNGELRSAAGIMQAVSQYVAGLDKPVKKIKASDVLEALSTTESIDDQVAMKYLVAIYANKPKVMHRALLDTTDAYKVLRMVITLNTWLLNQEVLGTEKHKSVWWSKTNQELLSSVNEYSKINPKRRLKAFAAVQEHIVQMKIQSASFLVPEISLMSAVGFRAIQSLEPYLNKSKSDN